MKRTDFDRRQQVEEWDSQLEEYLLGRVNEGDSFFKSRYIADDLNTSPKKVGAGMYRLQEESTKLDIDTWGGKSDGTTWYISTEHD